MADVMLKVLPKIRLGMLIKKKHVPCRDGSE